ILMQGVPFAFRYDRVYQKISKWVFMITNTIGVLLNMIDFGYYKFTLKRTTATIFEQFSHEENKFKLSLEARKSTRLNSSHVKTSYAVFCLINQIFNRVNGCFL